MKELFEFGEFFKQYMLAHIPRARLASGGTVINCRCFECGDSSNLRSAHMYLFPPEKGKPASYYCHLCQAHGLITHTKLIEWNIYESDMAQMINEHNSTVSKHKGVAKSISKRYNTVNDYITMDEVTKIKMDYINNRLGLQLGPQDFLNLKIVLNLNDLLSRNQTSYTRNKNIINDLDRAFVGFLSLDNAFVTMRRLDNQKVYESVDYRYVNYRIYDKDDTTQRFYVIPTRVNLMSVEPIQIHISEGAFDIISVYYHLRHQTPGVYAGACGSNYIALVMYFIETFKVPNLSFHLYPDNDKYGGKNKLTIIGNVLDSLGMPLWIHRNISPKEKDFGVSPDRIKESVTIGNKSAQFQHFYNA